MLETAVAMRLRTRTQMVLVLPAMGFWWTVFVQSPSVRTQISGLTHQGGVDRARLDVKAPIHGPERNQRIGAHGVAEIAPLGVRAGERPHRLVGRRRPRS